MAVNLSTPSVKTINTLRSLHISWGVEDGIVTMSTRDGKDEGPRVSLAASSFFTGLQAQTGTAKQRAWKLYMSEAGLAGTVV